MSFLKAGENFGEGGQLSCQLPVHSTLSVRARWIRRGLSLFIVFHLVAVFLAPNGDNQVGLKFGKMVNPYLNFFEMTNCWNFFSPNPEPPIYIEFEVMDASGQILERSTWPDRKDPFFIRERQNRRVSATDFMIAAELRTEKMMVPYLCGRAPLAHGVRLWRVMYTFPTAQQVVQGERVLGDDVGVERRFVSYSSCEGVLR